MMWKKWKHSEVYFIIIGIYQTVAFDCGSRPRFDLSPSEFSEQIIDVGEIPWHVPIYKDSEYLCDGNIIGERWILTSALCLDSKNSVHDIHVEVRNLEEIVTFRVDRYIQNTELTSNANIFELTEIIPFDELIKPICVNREDEIHASKCFLTLKYEDSLTNFYQVNATIANETYCQTQYPGQDLDDVMCVKDTEDCEVDGPGSVLYCEGADSLFYATGILSQERRCNGMILYEKLSKSSVWVWEVINADKMQLAARSAFVPMARTGDEDDACSGETLNLTSTEGSFTSPLYDGGTTLYPLKTDCAWTIFAPENYKILLYFDDFNVEVFGVCMADWVKAYDGPTADEDNLIAKICGNFLPGPILSTTNIMTVTFKSDFVEGDLGFLAKYISVHHSVEDSGCGSPRDVRSEIAISSRGYPSDFITNPGDNCIWYIQAPEGKKILFDFMNFRMTVVGENELRIYDGSDTSTAHYHAFDTHRSPKSKKVISSTNEAVLELKVWNYMKWSAKGFHAQLKFIEPNDTEIYPDAINLELTDYTGLCGEQDILPSFLSISGKIVNGNESVPNSWPWQVNLRKKLKPITEVICGGTLISHSWVVTAAHCTTHPTLYVFAGDHELLKSDYKMQIAHVRSKITHENFQNGAIWNNDIALLELDRSLRFTEFVRPACIPTLDVEFDVGTKCYATGWGLTSEGDMHGTPTLHEAPIPLISREKCAEIYVSEFTDNMVCGGYLEGGIDACQGDSGGPLVCRKPGEYNWVLFGITSWGWGCGKPNFPGVYVRVNRYGEWIQTQTNKAVRMNFNNSGPMPTVAPTTPAPTTEAANTTTAPTTIPTTLAPICQKLMIIEGGEGGFKSFSRPITESEYLNCTWSLRASHTAAYMRIEFKDFDLPVLNVNSDCGDDYIFMKIIDAEKNKTTTTKKYCGSINKPSDISAFSVDIYFIYNATSGNEYTGFEVEYKEYNPCSEVSLLINKTKGILFSPSYPGPYPSYMRCTWKIDTEDKMTSIEFKTLDLAVATDGTCIDNIVIKSEDDTGDEEMYGPYCTMDEPIYLGIAGDLTIMFESASVEAAENLTGFLLSFEQYVPFEVFQDSACFSIYYVDENANFTGSKVEDKNVEDPICKWTIMGTTGHPISLLIKPWKDGSNIDCDEHFIKLFYGENNETICLDPPMAKSFLISEEEVMIEFVGPMVKRRIGFDASFKFVEGGTPGLRLSLIHI